MTIHEIIHDMYAGLIQEDASSLYFAFVFDKEVSGGSWSEISFDSADIQELRAWSSFETL